MLQHDAARRPGDHPSAAQASSLAGNDTSSVRAEPLRVTDLTPVPDWPLPGRPITAAERLQLTRIWGPHIGLLIDSGALQVRRGRGAWFYRPGQWTSMTPADQTALVVELLNGEPSREVA